MAGSHSPELARLFDVCERIEMAHAQLYRMLAEAHAAEPTVAALWRKTANEEEGHAAQFRLASTNYSGAVESIGIDLAQATQVLDSVRATVNRVHANPPGIVEALQAAIRMEEAMSAMHMDQIARFKLPAHQKLFKAMMSSDNGHVQSLRDALARFESDATRTG